VFRQREVVLTILRTSNHDGFPEGIIGYVPALKHFASQGRLVDDGGVSGYQAPGPFGFGAFVGLAFFGAPPIEGVALPDNALAGVFLTEGELAMATTCSVRRVLNRLGKAQRYFPVPFWSDPNRPSVYSVGDANQSLLAKIAHASLPAATATLRGNAMHLRLPSSFAAKLAERIEARAASALLPGRERGVEAALVWSPGQQEPEAIFVDGPPPTAYAATFVALVHSDADQDDIRFMEDGYAVLLSARSADRLVAALRAKEPFEVLGGVPRRSLAVACLETN
jgi:hypothetical protein